MKTALHIGGAMALALMLTASAFAQTDVEIEFKVDMSVEIATGNFDPTTDVVVVAGSFNGWDTTADTLVQDFVDTNLFSKLVDADSVMTPDTLAYKFVTRKPDPEGGDDLVGWESVDNRQLIITGTETDEDGNGRLDVDPGTPTFNDASLDDFFSQAVTVTFEVDLRPAFYFFADSLFLPSDIQTGETVTTWNETVFANGPLSNAPGGWADWGPDALGARPELQLFDDGASGGDATAGDTVYTFQVSYEQFDARVGDMKFGTDGYDNESLFGANHRLTIPDDVAEVTIPLIFGAMETSAGIQDALYDPYIVVGPDGSASVVRTGGTLDAPEAAMLQIVHNAADPAAAAVDVYLNDGAEPLLADFGFREATPFMMVPAAVEHQVGIAPAGGAVIATIPVGPLTAGKAYIAAANGVLDPAQFAENPDGEEIGFELISMAAKQVADDPTMVEGAVLHGATDAPTVDIVVRGQGTVVQDAKYGDTTDYFVTAPGTYILDVAPASASKSAAVVASFEADLSLLGGFAGLMVASGFLDPAANQDGPAFAIVAVLPDGTTMELPAADAPDPVDAEIDFKVDMTVEIATGNFDPAEDVVVVAGAFNGWDTTADTLIQDFVDPNLYSKLVNVDSVIAPETFEYKFVTRVPDPEGGDDVVGWESVDNRKVTVAGTEEDADGNGRLDVDPGTPTFNNASLDDFFSQAVTATFEVDLRPAFYFFADSLFLPSDIQTGETVTTWNETVFANGPLSKAPNGWADWGPDNLGALTEQQLFDDGATAGDRVEGDTVYTFQVMYEEFDSRVGDMKFGTEGYDNESLFGANHRLRIPDDVAEVTVPLIFGAMETGTGDYKDDLFDPYIALTYAGPGMVSPVVVRSGGETGDTAVDVEELDLTVPERFVLGENYPNPFNPSTTIEYAVATADHVTISIYDISGRLVETLVDQVQSPATYRVVFDAANLSSGTYLYQMRAGDTVITKKMLLLK